MSDYVSVRSYWIFDVSVSADIGTNLSDTQSNLITSVGGFAGIVGSDSGATVNPTNVSNVEVTGTINTGTGGEVVGGFAGDLSNGNISNSYSAVDITASSTEVGGFIGIVSGNSSDSGVEISVDESNTYWDAELSGVSSSAELSDSNGLDSNQMKGSAVESNMSGFDFIDTGVWTTVDNDYPELSSN